MTIGETDPWLYFYEHFLAAYDPDLRRDAGAYYTPVEVVRSQVSIIHDLLARKLGRVSGFTDEMVITLDPAVGTGTYLLGVIDQALKQVEHSEGAGAIGGRASVLAKNLYGFEIMVGPYSVAELRLTRALKDRGATLPRDGPHVYLTDSLESPHTTPPQFPLLLRAMADQHKRALRVKKDVPVIVCLGNPPYDRHERAEGGNKSRTGGWVRYGDPGSEAPAILETFTRPAKDAGHGGDLKNLYNLYIYFWRWALWKVFEQKGPEGPGVVSFISAASYLDGDAFVGMREHIRRVCDEVWIIDLGGEGRGTRQSENVFAIQTPVAIGVAARFGKTRSEVPATIHYTAIEGTRADKLSKLNGITGLHDFEWADCPGDWHAPFRPAGVGAFFTWPRLTDIFPWQHSGVQFKRTWPIAADADTLRKRWHQLLSAVDRREAFRETDDRRIGTAYNVKLTPRASAAPIGTLPKTSPMPPVVGYGYRSFDRQFIIADGRLISRPRPPLWSGHSDRQVYLTTLLCQPLGNGPAVTVCADIPDMHHFRGSYGAKEIMPLWRDAAASVGNVWPGLLDALTQSFGTKVTTEDLLGYVYAMLGQPAYTAYFHRELETREVRVPVTKNPSLFAEIATFGRRLIWLHTYGARFNPGDGQRQLPRGMARCTKAVSDAPDAYPEEFHYDSRSGTLTVGTGAFAPIKPEVWNFEVSGLQIVPSWLGYRMKKHRGKQSSPLDHIHATAWTASFTTEFLRLLWIVEATLLDYPRQRALLEAVVGGPVFRDCELAPVPDDMREAPAASGTGGEQKETQYRIAFSDVL